MKKFWGKAFQIIKTGHKKQLSCYDKITDLEEREFPDHSVHETWSSSEHAGGVKRGPDIDVERRLVYVDIWNSLVD